MTTAAKGFRYEFKRKNFGSGTIPNGTTVASVPMGANYFIFINHCYVINSGSISSMGVDFQISKDIASSNNYGTLSAADMFNKYEFNQSDATNLFSTRIIMPAETFRFNGSESTSGTKYIDYTEIYFGGLSENI